MVLYLSIERLQAFSSKFVYWAGLVNMIWLLFCPMFIFTSTLAVLYMWPLYIIIAIPSYYIWRGVREGNRITILFQVFSLGISALIGVLWTIYVLVNINPYFGQTLRFSDYIHLLILIFPNIGIGVGAFLLILDLISMAIVLMIGGGLVLWDRLYLGYHYGPNLLIASITYLAIIILYTVNRR